MQNQYTTKAANVQKIAAAVMLVVFILTGLSAGRSEERVQAWIICQPNDYINVREKAKKKSDVIGRMDPGDWIMTDGEKKNGFMHVYGGFEQPDAWIFAGYVTTEEPEWKDRDGEIDSKYRVACRKWMDGPRRRWVRDGDRVHVYWQTGTWSVTNRGFIKTEYIILQAEDGTEG